MWRRKGRRGKARRADICLLHHTRQAACKGGYVRYRVAKSCRLDGVLAMNTCRVAEGEFRLFLNCKRRKDSAPTCATLLLGVAAFLTLWTQGSPAATVIPTVFASAQTVVLTEGGFDSKGDPTESKKALPLLEISTAGGTSAIPNTSALATASATGGLDPTVSVRAEATGGSGSQGTVGANAFATASLRYYLLFKGPATDGFDVELKGYYGWSLDGDLSNPQTDANLSLSVCCDSEAKENIAISAGRAQQVGGATVDGIDFSFDETFIALPNVVYVVRMSVVATVVSHPDKVVAISFIDPTFTSLDPNYTIEYSPGLLSSDATPLPATLPLFASALGSLSLLGWRRRRRFSKALAA
jgi:hypothetical protein